jgi:hypothetical protein
MRKQLIASYLAEFSQAALYSSRPLTFAPDVVWGQSAKAVLRQHSVHTKRGRGEGKRRAEGVIKKRFLKRRVGVW